MSEIEPPQGSTGATAACTAVSLMSESRRSPPKVHLNSHGHEDAPKHAAIRTAHEERIADETRSVTAILVEGRVGAWCP